MAHFAVSFHKLFSDGTPKHKKLASSKWSRAEQMALWRISCGSAFLNF